ncbi:MAG: hypothetical protein Q8P18_21500 [Pseudomonadota bacterium]|nr:hypothetical protein [Pseudomonadota bacterium]
MPRDLAPSASPVDIEAALSAWVVGPFPGALELLHGPPTPGRACCCYGRARDAAVD